MRVVVDTTIWSPALRCRPGALSQRKRALVLDWSDLVRRDSAILIGTIRQEILSGIHDEAHFDRLRDHLRFFDDQPLTPEDYEQAARFGNTCRSAGVSGSLADFPVCAVAVARGLPVFTADPDFDLYERYVPIRFYRPGRTG